MKEGDFIFLSASVPYRPEWTVAAEPVEIEEAVVSLARAVFARRGRLLFGGHPSISPLVSAVAGEYYRVDPARQIRPVVTFQSEWFRGKLPDETWEMYRMGFSAIEWTPKEESQRKSLTVMRECMLGKMPTDVRDRNHLTPPLAMVVVGGMEGILEEAAIFFRNRRDWNIEKPPPLYAFEKGGGAARRLVEPTDALERLLGLPDLVSTADAAELRAARATGELREVEKSWRTHYAPFESTNFRFPPYASMVQWLVDGL
jgi:hypothetical protein